MVTDRRARFERDGHGMKTVNLRRYSDPDALREISPRTLVALMDEHREFLHGSGAERFQIRQLDLPTGTHYLVIYDAEAGSVAPLNIGP